MGTAVSFAHACSKFRYPHIGQHRINHYKMDNGVLKSPAPSRPFLTGLISGPPHKMSLLVSGMPPQECLIRFGGKPPPKRLINFRNGLVSGILPSVSVPPWSPAFFWMKPPRVPDLVSSIPPRGGVLPSCEDLLSGMSPYESSRQWATQTVPRNKTPVSSDKQAALEEKKRRSQKPRISRESLLETAKRRPKKYPWTQGDLEKLIVLAEKFNWSTCSSMMGGQHSKIACKMIYQRLVIPSPSVAPAYIA